MRLTVLGSGTCLPHPDRNPAGYLVQTSGELLLLDCGDGTTNQIARAGYNPLDISKILISHCHLDHISGLPALLHSFLVGKRTKSLEIFAPTGFDEIFRDLDKTLADLGMATTTEWSDCDYKRFVTTITAKPIIDGHLTIQSLEMRHSRRLSVGYRLTNKSTTIAYSGDSGFCPNLIELCQNADVAIIESSFSDDHATDWHLTPSLAAQIAFEAQVKHLVLSHIYPDTRIDLQTIKKIFPHRITIAQDLLKISLATD